MKFRMIYTKLVYILIATLICLALASLIVNILIMAEAGTFINISPAVTVVSLICSILLLTAAVLVMLNSKYCLTDKGITVLFGCIWFLIEYKDVYEIKEHSVTKELFLLYREPKSNIPDKTSAVQIIIKSDKNKAFCDAVKEKNNNILFTVYNPDEQ